MKKIFYSTIILLFTISFCFAQNNFLLQKWKMTKTLNCDKNDSTDNLNTSWDVEFDSINIATIQIRNSTLNTKNKFRVSESNLFIGDQKYQIQKLSIDSLIIKTTSNTCLKFIFVSHKQFSKKYIKANNQINKFFIYKTDTIYFPTKHNTPTLKNYSNYNQYFTKAIPLNLTSINCVTQFKFIVTKNGKIEEAIGNTNCNKKIEKELPEIITNMKNGWTPMYINNKPVNTLVRVQIKQNAAIIIN